MNVKKELENYVLELQNLELLEADDKVDSQSSGISVGCTWSSFSWFFC